MNFLSIDCSTDIGSLFIKTKNKTFSQVLQSDKSNNDLLMKQILDFFKENNIKFGDISSIFVNQGPGNFSGLRGSLATAKGVSLSKNLNLFGYNTFIWSCVKFFNKKDSIFSLIKFREKYFIKKFDKNLNSTSNVEEITEDIIIKKYDNKFKVIPKNVTKYVDEKILKLNNLCIVDLDHQELEFLQLKGLLDKELIKPLYLS
jgi:tRNA threonylcarbamoyl adenosine modification protein YeaZ